jgi:hypothetical protein
MGIMAGMLICAIIPLGYLTPVNTYIPYSFPAQYLYHSGSAWADTYGTLILQVADWLYVSLILVILVVSYVLRVSTLFSGEERPLHIVLLYSDLFEARLSRLEDLEPGSMIWKISAWISYSVIRSAYIVLVSGYELFYSRAWGVLKF